MIYEYKVVTHRLEEDASRELSALGAEGWEVITHTMIQGAIHAYSTWTLGRAIPEARGKVAL